MMDIRFEEVRDAAEKRRVCRIVLESLPLWFGIAESREEYCRGVAEHDFISVVDGQAPVGFVSVKRNNAYTAELYVIGLLEDYHRRGIGTRLLERVEAGLRERGYRFLEVKTLDESRESEEYARTRKFYVKHGFIPIDTLFNEWGRDNPCLIMIKPL